MTGVGRPPVVTSGCFQDAKREDGVDAGEDEHDKAEDPLDDILWW